MEVIKLTGIFLLIIILLKFKLSLTVSILCGAVATGVLFRLGVVNCLELTLRSVTSFSTISLLLIFYLITFIQRMLEARGQLALAQQSLNGIFNNRRINASLASMFIGLLPSPSAVTICSSLVDSSCEDYLTTEEKTFVASYYRHIPESFLPTYSPIILATQLSGVGISAFMLGMLPMVILLMWLGKVFYLRKVPKDTGTPPSGDKMGDVKNLFKSLWSIALTILLIIVFNMQVYSAALIAVVLNVFVSHFSFGELKPIFRSAFERKIIFSTVAIMVFKDIITATGVIETLPAVFAQLPIPTFLIFALIFFFGSVISGSTSIIVLCVPLAFAAMPTGGMPLLVLVMCFAYAAMQISPTHVCLAIVTEYFHVEMGALLKKTMPVISVFCAAAIIYYLGLTMLFA